MDFGVGPYQYEPLKSPKHIRLLQYQTNGPYGERYFELYQQSLTGGDIPRYTALSYTWGEKRADWSIQINGRSLRLTRNLYWATRAFAVVGESYWIDAICINQSDDVEKSLQIPLMKEIYAQAQVCLIWLGDESDQSDLAFQLIEDLSAAFNREGKELADFPHYSDDLQLSCDKTATKLQTLRDAGRCRCNSPEWMALFRLLQRPWFRVIPRSSLPKSWPMADVAQATMGHTRTQHVLQPDCLLWRTTDGVVPT